MGNSLPWSEVNAAVVELYAPGLSVENYVRRVFRVTSRLVPCVLGSHGVRDLATGRLEANFDRAAPGLAEAFGAFGRCMHKYQPTRFDPATNEGRPFCVSDFYSLPAFHDTEIYQEVYGPMGYRDHCFVNVPAGARHAVFVGVFRDDGIFGDADKEIMWMLQPHLANARQLAFAFSAASDVPVSPEVFSAAGFAPRECDVIYWLTQGKTNSEISRLMRIRADSVSRHLQTIYIKMGVEHRVAAVLQALDIARRMRSECRQSAEGFANFTVQTQVA